MGIYLIFGFFMLLSWLVSSQLKRRFEEYSQIPNSAGMNGKEIAEKMLRDNGIYDVQVISVEGQLTDHYNPQKKTVNLSPEVYHGRSVAAAAVSAHEVGHAVQHAQAYMWLQMRSTLVPIVSVASQWMQWVLLAGIIFFNTFPELLLIGIVMFASTTLFSIITLPVEFDATARGLAWINNAGITRGVEQEKAKNALKWAALTYVVAALSSLATLMYYIMIYLGGSRRD
jgi:Zn-dependent membrane protease YugP